MHSFPNTLVKFQSRRTAHTSASTRTAAPAHINAHVNTSAPVPAPIVDICEEPKCARHALPQGRLMPILISNYKVATIPPRLLQATSTCILSLLYNGMINLALDTDPARVAILI